MLIGTTWPPKIPKPPLFGSAAKCTWHEVQDAIREMLGSILVCGCASGSDMRQQNQSHINIQWIQFCNTSQDLTCNVHKSPSYLPGIDVIWPLRSTLLPLVAGAVWIRDSSQLHKYRRLETLCISICTVYQILLILNKPHRGLKTLYPIVNDVNYVNAHIFYTNTVKSEVEF